MTLPVFTRLELFVMVPLLSGRVPFRPRVCPFRVHVVRRLCVGFASGVVRLCVPHVTIHVKRCGLNPYGTQRFYFSGTRRFYLCVCVCII